MTSIPYAFAEGNGSMMEFTWDAAFWVFNVVSNFAYTRYNIIHPDIHKKQQELEKKYIEEIKNTDKNALELYKNNKTQMADYLTNFSVNTADELVDIWRDFFAYLFVKYMDGNIKYPPKPGEKNPIVEHPGYSEEWKRSVVIDTGDKLKVPKKE